MLNQIREKQVSQCFLSSTWAYSSDSQLLCYYNNWPVIIIITSYMYVAFVNVKLAIPGRIIFSLTFRWVQICCSTFSCSFYYLIIKIFSNAFVESLTIFCYLILAVILHLPNFWFLLQINFDFPESKRLPATHRSLLGHLACGLATLPGIYSNYIHNQLFYGNFQWWLI